MFFAYRLCFNIKKHREFFYQIVSEEYCLNLAKKVSFIKEKKVVIKSFTDEEVKRMINVFKMDTYINGRNSCIVALLVDTGVINSELCYNKTRDARERFL